MTLLYLDASAIVKLILGEPQSQALFSYVNGADLLSCELSLVEVPRAIRRAAGSEPGWPRLLAAAEQVLGSIALRPLDRGLLSFAGALDEPLLRALDAIHVAAAIDVSPIDAFVTYDERQAATARLAGLRTMSPGT